MKLKKILITAAFVITSAAALSTAASAEPVTDANGQPVLTTQASDILNTVAAPTTTVPSINLNIQAAMPTTAVSGAVTGAVLGNSTPEDSASTGDSGVTAAVAVMIAAAGVGSAAVALKLRKK